jgi:hypothetical protein
MNQIVLTPEQAAVVDAADKLVAVVRPDGTHLGWISPATNFVIPKECPSRPRKIAAAQAEAAGPGPWFTTQEVLDHLGSLKIGR